MPHPEPFVDIHCHLLPGVDDGAKSWQESLAMARMAAAEGVETVVATPHQLGAFSHNNPELIRTRTRQLQQILDDNNVPLRVLPGADVRIEAEIAAKLRCGQALTLADRRKHVLLELPHELYFPLEPLLDQLDAAGIVGILSHPERNQGLLKQPQLIERLVQRGCLMQITADSLTGTFGRTSQKMAQWLLEENRVHFVATDAHGAKARRPLMQQAFHCIAQLAGADVAVQLCCRNPSAVAVGQDVVPVSRNMKPRPFSKWLRWRKAG